MYKMMKLPNSDFYYNIIFYLILSSRWTLLLLLININNAINNYYVYKEKEFSFINKFSKISMQKIEW